ncbi:PapD-like protein [Blastocladiella britannica]|nr:PapD-like protein [Blastocladiella britannica]
MALVVDPSQQLTFPRPFTDGSTVALRLSNPTDSTIAYKVKTTAPKQYCVRPNCGNIGPNESIELSVLLQPIKVEPPPGFKCRDKFLIQSVQIASVEVDLPSADLWQIVEKSRKELVIERKLRVAYTEPPSTGYSTLDPARVPLPNDDQASSDVETSPVKASSDGPTSLGAGGSHNGSAVADFLPAVTSQRAGGALSSSNSMVSTFSAESSAAGAGSVPSYSRTITPAPPMPELPELTRGSVLVAPPLPTPEGVAAALASANTAPPAAAAAAAASSSRSTPPAPSQKPNAESAAVLANLEAKVALLEQQLSVRDRRISQLEKQEQQLKAEAVAAAAVAGAEIRHRSVGGGPSSLSPAAPQVITRTIVNPSYYSPQIVLVIAVACFLVGVIVY